MKPIIFMCVWTALVSAWCGIGTTWAEDEPPGPREPLDARHAGLYGGTADYFLRVDTPFDFFVVQALTEKGKDNRKWRDWLLEARKNGKRVIVNLLPRIRDGENDAWRSFHSLDQDSPPDDFDRLLGVVDEFLEQVGAQNLYAMTLSEEHIFWKGHADLLNQAYERIKAKHDIPVYQWYSPSMTGSIPGINYPNLKADGWIADEYHLGSPHMERAMRGFTVLRKPVVMMSFAGGDHTSVAYLPNRFMHQVEMSQKYNVPQSYFTWYGKGAHWGFTEGAPSELVERFELIKKISVEAGSLEGPNYKSWDEPGFEVPVIGLAFSGIGNLTGEYVEKFEVERGVRFANDSVTENFADLKWDSSPVWLCPRNTGEASTSFTYRFDSSFTIQELRLEVGFIRREANSVVAVEVLNERGESIARRKISLKSEGFIRLRLPSRMFDSTRFDVKFEMSGIADQPNQLLAGITSIHIAADVKSPEEKIIDFSDRIPAERDPATGAATYRESLAAMSLYHTATINAPKRIRKSAAGLHAFPGDGALAVVQKVRIAVDSKPTKLTVTGAADAERYEAHFGIGVSLDGQNILTKRMTAESFSGDLELPLDEVADQLRNHEFYIHLILNGGYGTISAYSVTTNPEN